MLPWGGSNEANVKLYHRTNKPNAIIEEGFRDGKRSYRGQPGVWLADSPVDPEQGGGGVDILEVNVPDEAAVSFEIETNKDERIFFIPAATLNSYGKPRICAEGEFPQPPKPTAEELEDMLRSDDLEN